MTLTGATGWVLSVQLLPMQHSLGWSRSELVGALTVFSLLSGILAATLGPVMDRYGTRALMTVSALLAGACLVSLGLVTAPWQYYLVFGVGLGLAAPALQNVGPSVAIANWFVRRRVQAFAAFTLGSTTAGIVLAPLVGAVAHLFDWRTGWLLMGVLTWCIVPLAWLAVRRRPEEVGLLPDGAPPEGEPAAPPPQGDVDPGEASSWSVGEALRTRVFWLLVAAFTLTSLPASSIYVHMAPYASSKGLPAAAAIASLTVYGLGGAAGRFLWAFIIRRLGMHRALICFGCSYGLTISAFTLAGGVLALYATTALLGLSIAGSQQLQSQSFADYFGRRIVGSLLGYAGLFFMVSRAVAPTFAAVMFDRLHSYELPFALFAGACFLAGAAFLLAFPPRRREATAPEPVSAGLAT